MEVTTVHVNYKRTRNLGDYNNAAAEIGYDVQLGEGDDFSEVTITMIKEARTRALQAVGIKAKDDA